MRLICILCVTVLVCGVFSGCQLFDKEPQATEDPSEDPSEEPTGGDSTDEPTGGNPSDGPNGGDSTDEPSDGGSTDEPSDGDGLITDRPNNPTIPYD